MNLAATKWTDIETGLYIEVTSTNKRGPLIFAVRDGFGNCLSKSGDWDPEPMPSTRSPEYLASHRYAKWAEAFNALDRNIRNS